MALALRSARVTDGPESSPGIGAGVIASWKSENVRLGEVESSLSRLRRHEQRAAVRTSVLTLVVIVDDQDTAEDVLGVVRGMGGRHPSRTLVLVSPDEGGIGSRIDASATVETVGASSDGPAVCFESLVLTVFGPVRHHLDSVVRPFTLPDLPVVVWTARSLPGLGDPLLEVADRLVVDTRGRPGPVRGTLAAVRTLARRLPVADLSWSRLATWRQVLAGLLEGPDVRGFLEGIEEVGVSGGEGRRHLLGGWLMDKLGVRAEMVELEAAEHVGLRILARSRDGRTGRFEVVRPGNERLLRANVDIDGGLALEQTVLLGDNWPGRALAELLTRPPLDNTYSRALAGALKLAAAIDGQEAISS
ncbi:MAG: glucose-6-phosphate dehydrogenase assembly protein OpcA [Acidimicrobiales bacterium]